MSYEIDGKVDNNQNGYQKIESVRQPLNGVFIYFFYSPIQRKLNLGEFDVRFRLTPWDVEK